MYCLDSTFCIDLLNGVDNATECFKILEGKQDRSAIPAPALTEFLVGAHFKGGKQLDRALELAAQPEVLELTSPVAIKAARLGGECLRRGTPVGNLDLMIAATATRHHATLVTRDEDFSRIPGVATQAY